MGFSWACRHWPFLVQMLLLGPKQQDGEQIAVQTNDPSAVEAIKTEKIDERAWTAFSFFVLNLAVCVLWYANIYSSAGTENPSWTDIFGR